MRKQALLILVLTTTGLVLASGCRERGEGETDAGTGFDAGRMDAGGGGMCTPTAASENTVELCTDGIDNDCDTHTDCNDFDCCDIVACPMDTACGRRRPPTDCEPQADEENTVELCSDGCDNDRNGFTDCNDFSCCSVLREAGMPCGEGTSCHRPSTTCEPSVPRGEENTLALCTDGIDNDCNSFTDCNDFSCCRVRREGGEPCPNRTACNPQCDDEPEPEDTLEACTDRCDNDHDGFVDCNDFSCCTVREESDQPCPRRTACDPRCEGDPEPENTLERCTDRCDNDHNGFFDCRDFACCRVLEEAGRLDSCPATATCRTNLEDRPSLCPGADINAEAPDEDADSCSAGCDLDRDGRAGCDDLDCCGFIECGSGTRCGDAE